MCKLFQSHEPYDVSQYSQSSIFMLNYFSVLVHRPLCCSELACSRAPCTRPLIFPLELLQSGIRSTSLGWKLSTTTRLSLVPLPSHQALSSNVIPLSEITLTPALPLALIVDVPHSWGLVVSPAMDLLCTAMMVGFLLREKHGCW